MHCAIYRVVWRAAVGRCVKKKKKNELKVVNKNINIQINGVQEKSKQVLKKLILHLHISSYIYIYGENTKTYIDLQK